MAETTLMEVIAQRLETVVNVQNDQGKDIKDITKALAAQAVNNEQLRATQEQVSTLWKKFDDYCGPTGMISKVRDHQAQCPKPELIAMKADAYRSTKRLWAAIGLLATVYVTTLVAVLSVISKGG